eukprot:315316-Chlamydomonas_euryale.AAC.2
MLAQTRGEALQSRSLVDAVSTRVMRQQQLAEKLPPLRLKARIRARGGGKLRPLRLEAGTKRRGEGKKLPPLRLKSKTRAGGGGKASAAQAQGEEWAGGRGDVVAELGLGKRQKGMTEGGGGQKCGLVTSECEWNRGAAMCWNGVALALRLAFAGQQHGAAT